MPSLCSLKTISWHYLLQKRFLILLFVTTLSTCGRQALAGARPMILLQLTGPTTQSTRTPARSLAALENLVSQWNSQPSTPSTRGGCSSYGRLGLFPWPFFFWCLASHWFLHHAKIGWVARAWSATHHLCSHGAAGSDLIGIHQRRQTPRGCWVGYFRSRCRCSLNPALEVSFCSCNPFSSFPCKVACVVYGILRSSWVGVFSVSAL